MLRLAFAVILLALLPLTISAQDKPCKKDGAGCLCEITTPSGACPCQKDVKERPSIGVALEGGVALGLAHVGVLRWLEDNRVPIDCISGTSMGGLIAGLYSMGYSAQTPTTNGEENNIEMFLSNLLGHNRWESIFFDFTDYDDLSVLRKADRREYPNSFRFRLTHKFQLPPGVVSGHHVGLALDDLTWPYFNLESLDNLPIPLRIVATDLKKRKSDIFGGGTFPTKGSLSEALRATMSVPVYFNPVDLEVTSNTGVRETRTYVDGGLLNNLPVDALVDMGADIIIAVHLNEDGRANACDDPAQQAPVTYVDRSVLDVMSDTWSVVTSSNEQSSIRRLAELKENHDIQEGLCVNVDASGIKSTDFSRWSELIQRGLYAPVRTRGFREAIRQLQLSGHLVPDSPPEALGLRKPEFEFYKAILSERNKSAQSDAHPSAFTIQVVHASATDTKSEIHDRDMKEWVRRSLSCTWRRDENGQSIYSCPKYLPGRDKDETGCGKPPEIATKVSNTASALFSDTGQGMPFTEGSPTSTAIIQPSAFNQCHAKRLEKQLNRMVGTGRFSRLGYHLMQKEGSSSETYVAITAERADYTGALVQPLIVVNGSDYTNPIFTLGAHFTAFDVGPMGSELRGEVLLGSRYGAGLDYYQPLFGPTSNWFLAPRGTAESSPFKIYREQDQLADYQLRALAGALDLGYNFSRMAQLRVGYEGGGLKLSHLLGQNLFPFTADRLGTTSLKFSVDNLKFTQHKLTAPGVPRDGQAFRSAFQWHDAWLGATEHFPSASAAMELFQHINEGSSVYVRGDAGSILGYSNAGLPLFSLGGAQKMAAYGTNELLVNQYFYGASGYIHSVHQFQILGGAIYATAYFELAKPYGIRTNPSLPKDGTGGMIIDSVFGPLFVGGSVGDGGHKKFFFYMGKLF